MSFEPCMECQRHVGVDASACPFCGATFVAPRRSVMLGRVSRAAVFASATLVGGCWTSRAPAEPPVQNTPDVKPASVAGVVEGVITSNGAPMADVKVTLMRGSSPYEYQGEKISETQTDATGRYRFANLATGDYTIIVEAGRVTRTGWPRRHVAVPSRMANGGDMVIYPYDPQAPPMPYGAPPARRRIV